MLAVSCGGRVDQHAHGVAWPIMCQPKCRGCCAGSTPEALSTWTCNCLQPARALCPRTSRQPCCRHARRSGRPR
jgi:hypothetical protein